MNSRLESQQKPSHCGEGLREYRNWARRGAMNSHLESPQQKPSLCGEGLRELAPSRAFSSWQSSDGPQAPLPPVLGVGARKGMEALRV